MVPEPNSAIAAHGACTQRPLGRVMLGAGAPCLPSSPENRREPLQSKYVALDSRTGDDELSDR